MSFVELIFVLDSVFVTLQVIALLSSVLKCIKNKSMYTLSRRNKMILLLSILLPVIVFSVGYIFTYKGELNIGIVLKSILTGVVNTWGVAIPIPTISLFALIIDAKNRKKL